MVTYGKLDQRNVRTRGKGHGGSICSASAPDVDAIVLRICVYIILVYKRYVASDKPMHTMWARERGGQLEGGIQSQVGNMPRRLGATKACERETSTPCAVRTEECHTAENKRGA